MRKVFVLFVLLLSGALLAGCQNDTRETFVVGLEADYAPFNWMSPTKGEHGVKIDGQPGYADGYDVVMAKHIANKLNRRLVIKAIEWDGLTTALQNGEIDAIIAGMSPTEKRKQTVNFSDVYYRSEQVIVIKKGSSFASAKSLDDFSGAEIVNQLGTLQEGLTDQIPDVIKQTSLRSYAELIQAVRSSVSDGFIAELPIAMGATNANSDLMYVSFEEGLGFEVAEEEISVSIAFRKSDTELRDQVNEILSNISVETKNQWMIDALERQL
ncbi:MAG: transporter substrate-binding domain-containing protein [Acholeplasmataceae bacterium]